MDKIIIGLVLALVLAVSIFATANSHENGIFGSDEDGPEEELEERQKSEALKPMAKLTEQEAKDIARTVVSEGEITDVELEEENGVIVYAVEFNIHGLETDVKLDATTGKILKIEKDVPGSNADMVWEFD